VTEAGTVGTGTIKSAIGIGSLLADGIGDTIRVSLTADSIREVEVGHEILKALRLGRPGVNIIACPTCGRLAVDLFKIAQEVEDAVKARKFEKDLNVALMGCAVNGPGEAAGADLGVACGRGRAHLFKRGKIIKTIPEDGIVEAVLEAIETWDESESEVEEVAG
jgi:(E)-4-hydroxy-3-methylbut-2-enyl-diphosphate synthase